MNGDSFDNINIISTTSWHCNFLLDLSSDSSGVCIMSVQFWSVEMHLCLMSWKGFRCHLEYIKLTIQRGMKK